MKGFERTLGHIGPQAGAEVQAEAARGVAERLLGMNQARLFMMMVNPNFGLAGKDTFMVIYLFPLEIHLGS